MSTGTATPTSASSATSSTGLLPLFMTRETKYVWGGIFALIATFLYLASNHFPMFTPRQLPMTWVDQAVPFVPNTVFIYVSEYTFFWAAYILCRDSANLNKYLYAFFWLQVISVIIFWIWPTTYPRELYPLPEDLNPATWFVFSSLRNADSPNSCCPSLHVSSVYLTTFIFLNEQKRKFPFFFLWGTLIAASTLTTKQHYLVDVIAGFFMAVIFYWVFYHLISYRSVVRPAQAKR